MWWLQPRAGTQAFDGAAAEGTATARTPGQQATKAAAAAVGGGGSRSVDLEAHPAARRGRRPLLRKPRANTALRETAHCGTRPLSARLCHQSTVREPSPPPKRRERRNGKRRGHSLGVPKGGAGLVVTPSPDRRRAERPPPASMGAGPNAPQNKNPCPLPAWVHRGIAEGQDLGVTPKAPSPPSGEKNHWGGEPRRPKPPRQTGPPAPSAGGPPPPRPSWNRGGKASPPAAIMELKEGVASQGPPPPRLASHHTPPFDRSQGGDRRNLRGGNNPPRCAAHTPSPTRATARSSQACLTARGFGKLRARLRRPVPGGTPPTPCPWAATSGRGAGQRAFK